MANKSTKNKTIEIDKERGICLISINPEIYPLDVVYSAAYVFIDKAYVILDGNPKKEIKVTLKPKEDCDLDKIGMEFGNELLNYAVYKEQSSKNKGIREAIMQRALVTNDLSIVGDDELFNDDFGEKEMEDYLEDPEGIAIPWEEKYNKNNKEKEGNDKINSKKEK